MEFYEFSEFGRGVCIVEDLAHPAKATPLRTGVQLKSLLVPDKCPSGVPDREYLQSPTEVLERHSISDDEIDDSPVLGGISVVHRFGGN